VDDGFVIEVDGESVGAMQDHEEDEPMYRHAGADIFITASRHGQGLGTETVRVLARHLFEEREHCRLTIDPAADNVAAIRAYEKRASAGSGSCVSTSAVPTAPGTMGCWWTCSRRSSDNDRMPNTGPGRACRSRTPQYSMCSTYAVRLDEQSTYVPTARRG
jgi:hypothetical protein